MAVTQGLPLMSLIFVDENSVIAAGHDCVPLLFTLRGNQWELTDRIDKGKSKSVSENSAMDMFKKMASRAQTTTDVELNSWHQNTITSVRVFDSRMGRVNMFSTTGVDGKLVIWRI